MKKAEDISGQRKSTGGETVSVRERVKAKDRGPAACLENMLQLRGTELAPTSGANLASASPGFPPTPWREFCAFICSQWEAPSTITRGLLALAFMFGQVVELNRDVLDSANVSLHGLNDFMYLRVPILSESRFVRSWTS